MADLSLLTKWALKNAKNFNISAIRFKWVDTWLPGFFDYRVKLTVREKEYIGRGTDLNENIAFDKALAEAVERMAVSDMDFPWATAAHVNYNEACIAAYRELLTIDRVLCHHFCKIPFKNISLKILDGLILSKNLIYQLSKNNLHLELCELRPVKDSVIVAAFIWSEIEDKDRVKGIVSGFGCASKIEEAALHATIECLRTALPVFFGNLTPQEWELKQIKGNPRWHFWMAQKVEAKNFLKNVLLQYNKSNSLDEENISIKDVSFTQINSLYELIPDIPLKVVKATSEVLIQPQFGKIEVDDKLIKRLKIFAGKLIIPELNVPHFYD